MELKELLEFVDWESDRIEGLHGAKTDRERKLWAATKVSEELGELNSEVLASLGLQRPHKVEKYTHEHLSEEVIDVILTALLLAKTFEVDVEDALEKKMRKLEQRIYTNAIEGK